jgi:hypothetical protein
MVRAIAILLLALSHECLLSSSLPLQVSAAEAAKLTLVSQQCLPKERVFAIGDEDFSYVSDMRVKLSLENEGNTDIYYLADAFPTSVEPAAIQIHRDTPESEWQLTYGEGDYREAFTLSEYKWSRLPPGVAIVFGVRDSSNRIGEHTVAVFVNSVPKQEGRDEIMSTPYVANKCTLAK